MGTMGKIIESKTDLPKRQAAGRLPKWQLIFFKFFVLTGRYRTVESEHNPKGKENELSRPQKLPNLECAALDQ
jgi:hypothetical protein